MVPPEEFADGPLLLPGLPAIPAPEFPGGTFTVPPDELPCATPSELSSSAEATREAATTAFAESWRREEAFAKPPRVIPFW